MDHDPTRRGALQCLGLGAGALFTLVGGAPMGFDLARAADPDAAAQMGTPLFVQISDTHIGFDKAANPDTAGTLNRTIDLVNALPAQPALILHTGDVTHLSKPAQFDQAAQLMSRLRVTELHVTPGEHDVTDGVGTDFFARYGAASQNRGY
ncbi:MAG: metallophosphoesterase, partial [Caulobacteraceae bacterium]|nr:metallophosphoesterase [Caulobacteraceae bacterium]